MCLWFYVVHRNLNNEVFFYRGLGNSLGNLANIKDVDLNPSSVSTLQSYFMYYFFIRLILFIIITDYYCSFHLDAVFESLLFFFIYIYFFYQRLS